jgi:hypothetical protein
VINKVLPPDMYIAKTNNAPNYVERFKVPTILMVMFNM